MWFGGCFYLLGRVSAFIILLVDNTTETLYPDSECDVFLWKVLDWDLALHFNSFVSHVFIRCFFSLLVSVKNNKSTSDAPNVPNHPNLMKNDESCSSFGGVRPIVKPTKHWSSPIMVISQRHLWDWCSSFKHKLYLHYHCSKHIKSERQINGYIYEVCPELRPTCLCVGFKSKADLWTSLLWWQRELGSGVGISFRDARSVWLQTEIQQLVGQLMEVFTLWPASLLQVTNLDLW